MTTREDEIYRMSRFDDHAGSFVKGAEWADSHPDLTLEPVTDEEIEKTFHLADELEKYEKMCEELAEALEYYANEKNWYFVNQDPRNRQRMVIGSIDTEGHDWIGGRGARIALSKFEKLKSEQE